MFYLKKNLPNWQRALRLCSAVFLALAANYFLPEGGFQIVAYVTAIVLASTGIIGFCPSCAMFGRNSSGQKK